MNKYCERCYARDAKPCMECNTCNPGHRNFRPAPHVPTNADRIRAMSDEELAKIIASDYIGERLHFCQEKLECNTLLESEDGIPEEKCEQCATDWLKQPAEEE